MITSITIKVKLTAPDVRDVRIDAFTNDVNEPSKEETIWLLENAINIIKNNFYDKPHQVKG